MKKILQGLALSVVISVGESSSVVASEAQTWPKAKPITWVVGFVAGGSVDALTRQVAHQLEAELGQTIVVENRPGAAGAIALLYASKAVPDGYTLITVPGPGLYARPQPEVGREMAAVAVLARGPMALVGPAATAQPDLAALLRVMKAEPDRWGYATSGLGTAQHLAGELLKHLTGAAMIHIPYKGGGQAVSDVLGNQVPLGVLGVTPLLPHIKAGRLKAYAVTSSFRLASLPDVPTMQEAGVPGYEATQWYAVLAPKGLGEQPLQILNAAINKIMASDNLTLTLETVGAVSTDLSPHEAEAFIMQDNKAWKELAHDVNMELQ